MVRNGKDELARIRVEHIIREDYIVEAMELIEMFCDLLLARFGLLESQKTIDPGLEEAIATLIWITPRMVSDVQEFKAINDQLIAKYGKEFAQACLANSLNNVNEKVMHKMSVKAPPKILIEKYLIEIAKSYNVAFEPDPTVMRQDEEYLGDLIQLNNESTRHGGGCGIGAGSEASGFMIQDSFGNLPPTSNMFPPSAASNMFPPVNPAASYPQQGPQFSKSPQDSQPFTQSHGGLPGTFDGGFQPPPYTSGFFTNDAGPLPPKNPNSSSNEPLDPSGFLNLPNVPFTTPSNSCVSNSGNVNGATGGVGTNSQNSDDVDFDDLSRRFNELKKKK